MIELIIRFENLYSIIYSTLIMNFFIDYLNVKLLSHYLFVKRNISIKHKLFKKKFNQFFYFNNSNFKIIVIFNNNQDVIIFVKKV